MLYWFRVFTTGFLNNKISIMNMKKFISTCAGFLISFVIHAQVEVTTKSFELASQNKHKNWFIIEAGRDSINHEI
ncbi:MAG: hypothetical protein MUC81_05905 [Bacteroidia bacterium]|jgi:hypothetical protein|nr:hypothetical protein [Bacteroidia bacterium]